MKKFAVIKRIKDNKYCPYRLQDTNSAEMMIRCILNQNGGTREDYTIDFITPEEYESLDIAEDLY